MSSNQPCNVITSVTQAFLLVEKTSILCSSGCANNKTLSPDGIAVIVPVRNNISDAFGDTPPLPAKIILLGGLFNIINVPPLPPTTVYIPSIVPAVIAVALPPLPLVEPEKITSEPVGNQICKSISSVVLPAEPSVGLFF